MKKAFAFGVLLALALLLSGCTEQGNGQIVGGDKDGHGCIGSAGYTWCEEKGKCLREWEEACTEEGGATVTNFDECIAAGNPAMESYPRKCSANGETFTESLAGVMSEEEARGIAEASSCAAEGTLKENAFYNDSTNTWWIDLEPNEANEGCNPACVVSVVSGEAEINWRCTGLLPE
ncbi:hypothetical protein KKH30_01365 [Candidatus Micrarchaeota archaeon]|nr:hypothetical protein [Candidatus Micrarchaeota archaeon]MBU1939390.1 hypothetical protein [Candidatus Micrarchaeota archaeon]